MAIDRDAVLARWPDLASIPDGGVWTAAIADADVVLVPANFGNAADLARVHYVAHALTLQKRSSSGGGGAQLSSVTVGPLSKSFSVQDPNDRSVAAIYGSTAPGKALLQLIKTKVGGLRVL